MKDALNWEIHKGDLLAYAEPDYTRAASAVFPELRLADVVDVADFAILVKRRFDSKKDDKTDRDRDPFVVSGTGALHHRAIRHA